MTTRPQDPGTAAGSPEWCKAGGVRALVLRPQARTSGGARAGLPGQNTPARTAGRRKAGRRELKKRSPEHRLLAEQRICKQSQTKERDRK